MSFWLICMVSRVHRERRTESVRVCVCVCVCQDKTRARKNSDYYRLQMFWMGSLFHCFESVECWHFAPIFLSRSLYPHNYAVYSDHIAFSSFTQTTLLLSLYYFFFFILISLQPNHKVQFSHRLIAHIQFQSGFWIRINMRVNQNENKTWSMRCSSAKHDQRVTIS